MNSRQGGLAEIPLPDADCRGRLIDLYARGLTLKMNDTARLVERTAGASAAFMWELLRRAALIASETGNDAVIEPSHIDEALHVLVVSGGPLTRSLLGAQTMTIE